MWMQGDANGVLATLVDEMADDGVRISQVPGVLACVDLDRQPEVLQAPAGQLQAHPLRLRRGCVSQEGVHQLRRRARTAAARPDARWRARSSK